MSDTPEPISGRPDESGLEAFHPASPEPRVNPSFQRDELPTDLAKPRVETDEHNAAIVLRHWSDLLSHDSGYSRHISLVQSHIELPRAAPPDGYVPRSIVHQIMLTVVED